MSEIEAISSPISPADHTIPANVVAVPPDEETIAADELRALLPQMGDEAKRRAFAAGIGIVVLKDGHLIEINANGSKCDLGIVTAPISTGLP